MNLKATKKYLNFYPNGKGCYNKLNDTKASRNTAATVSSPPTFLQTQSNGQQPSLSLTPTQNQMHQHISTQPNNNHNTIKLNINIPINLNITITNSNAYIKIHSIIIISYWKFS
ncbi:hypothetical protein Glove_155g130 [Diversispora epigaea]|uniref:Uncharacterized protein n=1 Tax=Diversispora epigaea TaxID=1348612 RepID=A0A397IVY9_9GLOM|nr:hypothetical protein Glove_155g130 [Diversispora epigaea]